MNSGKEELFLEFDSVTTTNVDPQEDYVYVEETVWNNLSEIRMKYIEKLTKLENRIRFRSEFLTRSKLSSCQAKIKMYNRFINDLNNLLAIRHGEEN